MNEKDQINQKNKRNTEDIKPKRFYSFHLLRLDTNDHIFPVWLRYVSIEHFSLEFVLIK